MPSLALPMSSDTASSAAQRRLRKISSRLDRLSSSLAPRRLKCMPTKAMTAVTAGEPKVSTQTAQVGRDVTAISVDLAASSANPKIGIWLVCGPRAPAPC